MNYKDCKRNCNKLKKEIKLKCNLFVIEVRIIHCLFKNEGLCKSRERNKSLKISYLKLWQKLHVQDQNRKDECKKLIEQPRNCLKFTDKRKKNYGSNRKRKEEICTNN